MSNLGATDLNNIKSIELQKTEEVNTNILITDAAPIVEVVNSRILSTASNSEIIFSTDATLAYEPDSEDNTESFDTVVVENPLPESE